MMEVGHAQARAEVDNTIVQSERMFTPAWRPMLEQRDKAACLP